MNQVIYFILFIATTFAFPGLNDRVIILPGLHFQPKFDHYSGYLNGSSTRMLHYWFVESQNSPSSDPLVLWLNGGPGCSSLAGLIMEHGPFRITSGGYLDYNPYSWNRIANIIYLESPACVGFSYSTDGQCNATDDSTSNLNYNALQHFFIKFPQFKNRHFYVTGESYGGFYVPTLAERIINGPGLPIQFKGIAVGNGLSSFSVNNNGNFHFAYYHGLISDNLWSEIMQLCCAGQNLTHCDIWKSKNPTCIQKADQAVAGLLGINVYNIYDECYKSPSSIDDEIWAKLNVYSNYDKFRILSGWNLQPGDRFYHIREEYKYLKTLMSKPTLKESIFSQIPCINETAPDNYFNDPIVRYALHIPDHIQSWSICSLNSNFHYKSTYLNMTNQYNKLFQLNNFKIWIYNGDVDMACSYLSDEWFFQSFNQKVISARRPWFYVERDESIQIGGYVKVFEKFVLITVRGSGHMVPTDKPIPAFYIFQSFINGPSL